MADHEHSSNNTNRKALWDFEYVRFRIDGIPPEQAVPEDFEVAIGTTTHYSLHPTTKNQQLDVEAKLFKLNNRALIPAIKEVNPPTDMHFLGKNSQSQTFSTIRVMKTSGMSSRKTKNVGSTTIEDIPQELITHILAKVGAASVTDLFNAKLSCKSFDELAEDKSVYQQVTLEIFPIVQWESLSEKQQAFLEKCKECNNPELLYRQAVVDYFGKSNLESAHTCLQKAVDLGHVGALYMTCIVLLLSGDKKMIDRGVKLLGCMIKSKTWKRKFRHCRNKLMNILGNLWIYYPHVGQRPRCCLQEGYHGTKFAWGGEIESTHCEACNADKELEFICSYLLI